MFKNIVKSQQLTKQANFTILKILYSYHYEVLVLVVLF